MFLNKDELEQWSVYKQLNLDALETNSENIILVDFIRKERVS